MAEERNYQADRNITRPRRVPEGEPQSVPSPDETSQFDASRSIIRARRGAVDEEGPVFVPQEKEKPKKKQRVSILMGIALTFIAVLFDVSELVLDLIGTAGYGVFVVIGWVKDITAFFFFPIIFMILKIPPWKGRAAKKKMLALLSAGAIAAVPWVGALSPETTVGVAATVYLTWLEDMEDSKRESLKKNYLRAKRIAGRFNR